MSKRGRKQSPRQWKPESGKNSKLSSGKRQLLNRRERREAVDVINEELEIYDWLQEVADLAD